MTRQSRQSGVAMALVLMILAIATTLGMSYLSAASISLAASNGFTDAARARYAAESGVEHAMCLLRENPDMIRAAVGTKLGPYYVDDLTASYVFEITPVGVPGYFTISSRATNGRSSQSVSVTVFHSGGMYEPISYASLMGGFPGYISTSVLVKGKMHGNGSVLIEGKVEGDVSAVGSVANLGVVKGTVSPNSDLVPFPQFNPDDYDRYLYNDRQGEAITTADYIIQRNHPIDNGRPITESNPAGVVIARPPTGSLWLWEDLRFRGTLVVHGDLVLDGWNMEIKALSGFPALVVTGRIFITYYAAGVNIEGVVYASEGVYDFNAASHSKTKIKGSFVARRGGYNQGLRGEHTVEHDINRTHLYHPQGWGTGGEVQILSWDR